MLDPLLRGGITLIEFLNPLGISVLQQLVVAVLCSPDIYFERKAARESGSRLKLLHQFHVGRVFQQLFRKSLDRSAQGKSQRRAIQIDVSSPGLVKERIYTCEIQVLRIFKSRAEAAVQRKLRGH